MPLAVNIETKGLLLLTKAVQMLMMPAQPVAGKSYWIYGDTLQLQVMLTAVQREESILMALPVLSQSIARWIPMHR